MLVLGVVGYIVVGYIMGMLQNTMLERENDNMYDII